MILKCFLLLFCIYILTRCSFPSLEQTCTNWNNEWLKKNPSWSCEAMMAALGAVFQHYITFPGSALQSPFSHLWIEGMCEIETKYILLFAASFSHRSCSVLNNLSLSFAIAFATPGLMKSHEEWRHYRMALVFSASSCSLPHQDFGWQGRFWEQWRTYG